MELLELGLEAFSGSRLEAFGLFLLLFLGGSLAVVVRWECFGGFLMKKARFCVLCFVLRVVSIKERRDSRQNDAVRALNPML